MANLQDTPIYVYLRTDLERVRLIFDRTDNEQILTKKIATQLFADLKVFIDTLDWKQEKSIPSCESKSVSPQVKTPIMPSSREPEHLEEAVEDVIALLKSKAKLQYGDLSEIANKRSVRLSALNYRLKKLNIHPFLPPEPQVTPSLLPKSTVDMCKYCGGYVPDDKERGFCQTLVKNVKRIDTCSKWHKMQEVAQRVSA